MAAAPDSDRFDELPDEPAQSPQPSSSADRPKEGFEGIAEQDGEESDEADGEDDAFEDSIWWTQDELTEILSRSHDHKKRGNAEFGQGKGEAALETYKQGLEELPVRTLPHNRSLKGKEKATKEAEGEGEAKEPTSPTEQEEESLDEEQKQQAEVTELRAILHANVAACLLKLERYTEAVKACDDALEEKPDYTKALHRRAMANESIGSWGSLSTALEDFTALLSHADLTPLQRTQITLAKKRLPQKIEVQQQKEKDEVLGKLKDLGNTVLGKFGMSTENFKFVQQEGGGYSMQFQQ
ncbi:hypothetical protein JCM11641_002285 [Rhodosporidiobolus odoratus]